MEPKVFRQFRDLIHDSSGISLSDNKVALLSARIGKRMREKNIMDPDLYFRVVVADKSGEELGKLLNAISTNVTHFFRESQHFDFLARKLRELPEQETGVLRIWCAACSTGEEPYTIAMTVMENLKGNRKFEIIASDISTKVLQIAKFGVYKAEDVGAIDQRMLKKYFQKGSGKADSFFRVKDNLRKFVTFKQINLSTPPFPIEGLVDFIFCRNVMIYFNDELKTQLARNFHTKLKPSGHLIVGLAESMTGKTDLFQSKEPSVYVKKT